MQDTMVDSNSLGDSAQYRSLAELEQMLSALPSAPEQRGRVALMMSRGSGGRRQILDRIILEIEEGVPGDAWGRPAERDVDAQIAVMQKDVAELIANGQPLTLFGDCLFLDLDLSAANLPPATRVRVGDAILEVTPKPHNGCRKFLARFGEGALRFVSKTELRHRNLRGIYMRVVQAGEVKTGDPVEVIQRHGS